MVWKRTHWAGLVWLLVRGLGGEAGRCLYRRVLRYRAVRAYFGGGGGTGLPARCWPRPWWEALSSEVQSKRANVQSAKQTTIVYLYLLGCYLCTCTHSFIDVLILTLTLRNGQLHGDACSWSERVNARAISLRYDIDVITPGADRGSSRRFSARRHVISRVPLLCVRECDKSEYMARL